MAEEIKAPTKKKSGWFQKIPTSVLLSPAGAVIILLAVIIEIIGFLLPIPIFTPLLLFPIQAILVVLLVTVGGVSFKSLILPYAIDFFFPFLPTWIIRILW